MSPRVSRVGYLKVLAVAGVMVLVTCTVDREPLAPGRLEGPRFTLQSFQGPQIFVGAGDIASCVNDNDAATATLIDGIAGTVFTAGDDAYPNGRAVDYSNCYDPTWGRFKARTWAVLGNHEYDSSATAQVRRASGTTASTSARGISSSSMTMASSFRSRRARCRTSGSSPTSPRIPISARSSSGISRPSSPTRTPRAPRRTRPARSSGTGSTPQASTSCSTGTSISTNGFCR